MNKKAFSLAELMIVMLILTIILAATMPILSKRAKVKTAAAGGGASLWETTIANANDIHNLNSRNVGIGTNTPGYLLDIVKTTTPYASGINNFAYGESKSRTEMRDNAGLQGDAGAQSGFFQTSSPTNYPTGASSWWHLLDIRHSNPANNYALQIAGSFFDQRLFYRKTNGSAATEWTEIQPTGSVIAFAGSSAPGGWLLCNGASLLRTDYPALFSIIGTTYGSADSTHFNIPDLRGIFVRGAGTSTALSKANGAAFSGTLGTYQNDKFQGHTINYSGGNGFTIEMHGGAGGGYYYWMPTYAGTSGFVISNDGTNGTPRTGTETNPANLSLNYIIKY